METVHIKTTQREYDIKIGHGILDMAGTWLKELFPKCPSVMVITDDKVYPLYCRRVMESIENAGFNAQSFVMPNGEANKHLGTVTDMLIAMEDFGMQRQSVVVALGGGVVGDMAGLAAALYMRGIAFIQIPTTLLAAQDSSVGGKTAVNLGAKNIAGAFWQPSLVICDCDTLQSLPADIFADGMAEMVKHGILSDSILLEMLEKGRHKTDLEKCIYRSVCVKANVVQQDEREADLRALLNFGHTVAHAIEHCSGYTVTHGSAVAAGICIMARACEKQGIAKVGTAERIVKLMAACDLPTTTDLDPKALYDASLSDKKRSGGGIKLVRIRDINDCYISPEPVEALKEIISSGV